MKNFMKIMKMKKKKIIIILNNQRKKKKKKKLYIIQHQKNIKKYKIKKQKKYKL